MKVDFNEVSTLLNILSECAKHGTMFHKIAAHAYTRLLVIQEDERPAVTITKDPVPIYPKDAPQAKTTTVWEDKKEPIDPPKYSETTQRRV